MHGTFPSPGSFSPARSRVRIDWSAKERDERSPESLLTWVQGYPRREEIHVILSSVHSLAAGRRLQTALQSMGCTVTRRMMLAS